MSKSPEFPADDPGWRNACVLALMHGMPPLPVYNRLHCDIWLAMANDEAPSAVATAVIYAIELLGTKSLALSALAFPCIHSARSNSEWLDEAVERGWLAKTEADEYGLGPKAAPYAKIIRDEPPDYFFRTDDDLWGAHGGEETS